MISRIGVWDAEYAGSDGRRTSEILVAEVYTRVSNDRKSFRSKDTGFDGGWVVSADSRSGTMDAEHVSLRSVRSTITMNVNATHP